MKKRVTAFLFSDFVSPDFENALKIARYKHDLVAMRVVDQRERNFPNVGLVRVFDKESGKTIWMDTGSKSVRDNYAAWWRNKDIELEKLFKKCGIDYVTLQTGSDYVKSLIRLFRMRENRM